MALLTFLFEIALFAIVAILGYVFYIEYKHRKYFTRLGIPYIGAGFPRFLRMLSGRLSMNDSELVWYKESKEASKCLAGYTDIFVNPGVYVLDMDLAKHIYTKDFDHFVNRRKFPGMKTDLLFHKMIFMMEDEPWKRMRNKLSPSFTTGKIRRVFSIFSKSSQNMCDYLRERVGPSGGDFDIMSVYSKYAMDVIASCVFGVNGKSFECEPGKLSEFEEMGQLLQPKLKASQFLKFIVIICAPKLAEYFGVEATDLIPQRYFLGVIQQVLRHRRATGERQEDFLQLMMDIQKGLLKDNNDHDDDNLEENLEEGTTAVSFDDDDIAANCVLFLLAGFDTLQSVLIFAAYALALEPGMQQKLLAEIRGTMKLNGGELTYDAVHGMKYLDMFINETLRFYPPQARNERTCSKTYEIHGTNILIEKGVIVQLPITGLHRDPQHYQNPDIFDPERFAPERKSERSTYAFTPFGHGPRSCIGMRFALTEVKTAICLLVNNFQLEPCGRTDIPMKYSNTVMLKPLNGMWLHIQPRSS